MSGGAKLQALVVCAHLRPGRNKRRSRYVMQPISGLHIASLIGQEHFDVRLHHEDWHGPFDTSRPSRYDLVFLTGLQVDFDRMRQLAFHFRRSGAVVAAGGSICTVFPEFATRFFDAVCAGGVENAADVAADFVAGRLKPIYRAPIAAIRRYAVDYRHFARNGVSPSMHLIEASRGCSFKCAFCTMPGEVGRHAPLRARRPRAGARQRDGFGALVQLPPLVSDRPHAGQQFFRQPGAYAGGLRSRPQPPRRPGLGALVTQNVLGDRDLIRRLAKSKCNGLFVGVESLDRDLLRSQKRRRTSAART